MRHAIVTALAVLALGAHAQEGLVSYIEVDAEHTVYLQPNFVEFSVEFYVGPETEGDAAAKAQFIDEKQKAFRAALNELDLHPVEIEFTAPTVRSALPTAVAAAVSMKFSMAGFANPDTGPAQFAGFCDKLAKLAADAGARLTGPEFGVEDKESAVRNAVSQAVSNAYPIGDALALALSARVEAVDSVKVTEIIWSKQVPVSDKPATGAVSFEPNLRQIACTAKIHVTYAARSGQAL